jgi:hypothetical protein
MVDWTRFKEKQLEIKELAIELSKLMDKQDSKSISRSVEIIEVMDDTLDNLIESLEE